MERTLLTTREAVARLRATYGFGSAITLENAVKRGELKRLQANARLVRYPAEEIDAWAARYMNVKAVQS